jgi:hypothetical protein
LDKRHGDLGIAALIDAGRHLIDGDGVAILSPIFSTKGATRQEMMGKKARNRMSQPGHQVV